MVVGYFNLCYDRHHFDAIRWTIEADPMSIQLNGAWLF